MSKTGTSVVSPKSSGNGGFTYSWDAAQEAATGSAEFSEMPDLANPGEPTDTNPGDDIDGSTAGELAGEDGASCGCASGGAAAWWAVFVFPALWSRRRQN